MLEGCLGFMSTDKNQVDDFARSLYTKLMLDEIDQAVHGREESALVASSLHQKLKKADQRLGALKKAKELEQQALAFKPWNCKPYRKDLGPLRDDLFEGSRQIGQYRLGKLLGEGGFASVFVAKHKPSRRLFAVKRLEKSSVESAQELRQVCREIRVMRLIRHTNVVRCYDVIHGAACIYIVMGLSHTDLFTYSRHHIGEMDASTNREIAIGLLAGLDYLHTIGVAHLDIKPENILITKKVHPWELNRKHIQICDLGLCAIAPEQNPLQDIMVTKCGTKGFMCPEMILRRSCEGRQADMWSVGVTLLDTVQGLPSNWMSIWNKERLGEALNKVLPLVKERSYFLDAEMQPLISQLLSVDPNNRLTARDALQHWCLMEELNCLCRHKVP